MGAIARALPSIGRGRGDARRAGVRGLRRLRMPLLIAALAAIALAAGYMLWLRDSSLVAIEHVELSGVADRPDLAATLEAEARKQTTLHLDREALTASVAADPAVRAVHATADFPRGVSIAVELREPVGHLPSSGAIVAGDGMVLSAEGVDRKELPAIDVRGEGSAGTPIEGDALALARILGGAPAPLLPEVDGVAIDPDLGIVAILEGGVELRFGERARAEEKWRAAAAVLADRRLKEVAYLDLSVPERPVAGSPAAAAGGAGEPLE